MATRASPAAVANRVVGSSSSSSSAAAAMPLSMHPPPLPRLPVKVHDNSPLLSPTSTAVAENKHALLLLNNLDACGVNLVRTVWGRCATRACADGAANWIRRHCPDLVPDWIHGDLDSLSKETREFFKTVETVSDADQESNDITKCLNLLNRKRGVVESLKTTVIVLGVFGGRFDHEMGNLNSVLCTMHMFDRVVMLSRGNVGEIMHGAFTHVIKRTRGRAGGGSEGPHCGVIPLFTSLMHCTTTGLKWNLVDRTMGFGDLVSSSNLWADGVEEVTIVNDEPLLWTTEVTGFVDDYHSSTSSPTSGPVNMVSIHPTGVRVLPPSRAGGFMKGSQQQQWTRGQQPVARVLAPPVLPMQTTPQELLPTVPPPPIVVPIVSIPPPKVPVVAIISPSSTTQTIAQPNNTKKLPAVGATTNKKLYQPRDMSTMVCKKCHLLGHMAKNCPVVTPQASPATTSAPQPQPPGKPSPTKNNGSPATKHKPGHNKSAAKGNNTNNNKGTPPAPAPVATVPVSTNNNNTTPSSKKETDSSSKDDGEKTVPPPPPAATSTAIEAPSVSGTPKSI